jgi:creatinine amidohydrolase
MMIELGHLTREQVQQAAQTSLVILPIGAVEQHGPHLPINTDYYIVEHISRLVCKRLQKDFTAFVCPALPYGNSHHHFPYPALSLTSQTLISVLGDLVASLATIGFKHVFLLNSHGGNDEAIRIVTRDAAREHGISVAAASYWTIAWEPLQTFFKETDLQIGRVPGHAGGFETSLMLAIAEELVLMDRRPPLRTDVVPVKDIKQRVYIQRPGNSVGQSGYSDDSRNASKSVGEEAIEIIVEEVARTIHEFYVDNK